LSKSKTLEYNDQLKELDNQNTMLYETVKSKTAAQQSKQTDLSPSLLSKSISNDIERDSKRKYFIFAKFQNIYSSYLVNTTGSITI
jgi:hypothetical protein